MTRTVIENVEQLRSLPVGTTLDMRLTGYPAIAPLGCVVKVESTIYATPSDSEPGRAWSYYHEDEVAGIIQSDGTAEGAAECSWFPLHIDVIPS